MQIVHLAARTGLAADNSGEVCLFSKKEDARSSARR